MGHGILDERIRTEHNCVPRDIVSVRGKLLVGYHVVLGLKHEAQVQWHRTGEVHRRWCHEERISSQIQSCSLVFQT